MSTSDAEYRTIVMALQHGKFLKRMIESFPMIPGTLKNEVHTDNLPDLVMLFSLAGTKMSNFIDLRHHFIKGEIKKHEIEYNHVPSEKMKAEILTKPLTTHNFCLNRQALFLQMCNDPYNEGACET